METVHGISAARHHVMRNYSIMVVRAFRDELRLQGSRYDARFRRHAERLLRREPAYLSPSQRPELGQLLSRHQTLALMQCMREELGQLWESKHATPQELPLHCHPSIFMSACSTTKGRMRCVARESWRYWPGSFVAPRWRKRRRPRCASSSNTITR
jgi:hypothetical protein